MLVGQLTLNEWATFGLAASAGYARMWVDDHLLVDAPLSPASPLASALPVSSLSTQSSAHTTSASPSSATAKYAIPVPFLPGTLFSKIRIEVTTGTGETIGETTGGAIEDTTLGAGRTQRVDGGGSGDSSSGGGGGGGSGGLQLLANGTAIPDAALAASVAAAEQRHVVTLKVLCGVVCVCVCVCVCVV